MCIRDRPRRGEHGRRDARRPQSRTRHRSPPHERRSSRDHRAAPHRRDHTERRRSSAQGDPRAGPARGAPPRPAGPGCRDEAAQPRHPDSRVQHRHHPGPRHPTRQRLPDRAARPDAHRPGHRCDARALRTPHNHRHHLPRHEPDTALRNQEPALTTHELWRHVQSPGALAGDVAARFGLVDEYLAHLLDRNYSPKTVRAYGYDLLAFCRWLTGQDLGLEQVTTETLLLFLRACREATVPGRPGPNVLAMTGQRLDRYAATTINRRLAAISGLFTFASLRDPDAQNPVPKGRAARRLVAGERSGLLAHTVRRPKDRMS